MDKCNRCGRFEVARWMFEEMPKRKFSLLAFDGIALLDKMVGKGKIWLSANYCFLFFFDNNHKEF